jgi:UDP-glucose 4-epimerase
MKILVTGGCGFIGSHIVDSLIENKHEVAVVDNLSSGKIDNLNPTAQFYKTDITSKELKYAFEAFKPEVVYHEAAQIDVQKSIKEPEFDARVNILGTLNLLECCNLFGVKKILYASSAAVYGNPQYLGVDEEHPVNPISCYGISKHTPEHYIKAFGYLYGLKYTVLRYANVYGTRQELKGEGGVVSIFTNCMLKAIPPEIFGDGEQTRDYVYVKDIALANLAALGAGDNEIINIGTGTPVTVNRLFTAMQAIMDFKQQPKYGPARKGDITHSWLDNGKARKLLGWKPEFTLESGLSETIAYYR